MKKPNLKLKKRKKAEQPRPSRITNETVAEHREQILAGGRKFKYPHQYARHKLVFNAIIIILVTIVIAGVVIWWQLYPAQSTSNFFYRVTRVLPVPVASVDGTQVRYSDYLVRLKPSIRFLEESQRLNLDNEDGRRQLEFVKREALNAAIADTYAAKLARERGITVTNEEVDEVIDASLNTVSGQISQSVYDDSTLSLLGWDADEYRHAIRQQLVQAEVAYAIDEKAKAAREEAERIIETARNPELAAIAKRLQDRGRDVQLGTTGVLIPKTNVDGGVTQQAAQLEEGEISAFFRSNDGSLERNGYYIVQLIESNDKQVNYNYIRIPLTKLRDEIKALRTNNQIQEYIDVDENGGEVIRRQQEE